MIYRFFVTLIVSVLLGVILGTSSSFIPVYLKTKQVVKFTPQTQPVILANNDKSQVFEQKAEEAEEVIYFKEATAEMTQPVVESPIVEATLPEIPTEATSTSTPVPEPTVISEHTLNADLIFNLINEKRTQAGIKALEKEPQVCELANSRTSELYSEFTSGYLHRGFHARKLAYWAAENVIYMRTEQKAVGWWMNSPIHRSQLMGEYKYSCVACSGESCTQIFTNLTPKS
jgi:uncharacterized protein YkwD